MKKAVITLVIFQLSMQLVAQMPNWYLPTSRKIHFPEKEWYTGFVEGTQRNNETYEEAVLRLKNAARVELISTITTSIEHSSNSHLQSHQQQNSTYFEELIDELYESNTKMQSRIVDIHGLQVETYYNIDNKVIAAFAYLNKLEACQYYFNQLRKNNNQIMSQLSIVEYLISNNESFKARHELHKASEFINQVDEYYKWLSLFNCDIEQTSTLLTQHIKQKQIIDRTLSTLSHTTSLFMECEGYMFDMPCTALINKVKKQLSDSSCSFVASPEQADWNIILRTTAEIDKSRDNTTYNYVTIDVTGTMQETKNNFVYSIHKSEYNAAPKANGDERLVVKIIIEQESLSTAVANDIIEILKSK